MTAFTRALLPSVLLLAASAQPLRAHEFWIEPASHEVLTHADVPLNLQVGEGFRGEVLPRDARALARFDARLGAGDWTPVHGRHARVPAGQLAPSAPGLWTVVYASRGQYVELSPAEFERYLEEEGQVATAQRRAADGETDAPGRETFQRCAKSLVRAGDGPTAGYDVPSGLPLEILPLADPFAPASQRAFRVLWQGQPLAGIRVNAQRRGDHEHVLRAWTDAHGLVELPIEHTDDWLVHAVHMTRAPVEARGDWNSYWASLTTRLVSQPAN